MSAKKINTASPIPDNKPYLLAIVAVILIATILDIFIIWLRPEYDALVVTVAIFGIASPTTVSILAFMKSQETHLSVNSRLEEWIKNAESAARGEGMEAGRLAERDNKK